MKDFTKVKMAFVLSGSIFWLPVIIAHFQSLGFSSDQVYTFLSIYSFCIVLLEYPTGVVGDYYSHRVSMILGYIMTALALFLTTMSGNIFYYIVVMVILAVGTSLKTGSDYALMSHYSQDMKKDWADMTFLLMLWGAIASALGGVLGKVSLSLPIYISSACFFVAGILTLLTKRLEKKSSKTKGNVFNTAIGAVKQVKSSPRIIILVVTGAVMTAFFTNMRWFYTPLFQGLSFDIGLWGFLTSVGLAMTFVGNRFSTRRKSRKIMIYVLATSVCLFAISFLNPVVSMVGFVLIHVINGYLDMLFDIETNSLLDSDYRASVLSLKNFLVKILSTLYLFLWGLMFENLGLRAFFWINASGIFLLAMVSVLRKQLKRKGRVPV
jgi:MFS family permease